MLVKVNTSLVGADFSYNFGDEVDSEEFAARVGNGWENLCDAIAEKAVAAAPAEVAVAATEIETAVVAPTQERRGRRK
ncbi:hypothetical protein [Rhizobium aethiopicum]|uniref:Uncharacterized protein n=1 Tax=Rhizobium aethiopicum TaxID=1138170 RepID=A0A7W6MHU0_9HYPH|nr:hypothetical protein [Rhizobium aethiopicum]MBB4192787.1 hypothetical protein [Rhizobium aethiopicum]